MPGRQRSPSGTPRRPRRPIDRDRIHELGRGFNGRVGIAVRRSTKAGHRLERQRAYPQQSVSKFWVGDHRARRRRQGPGQLDDKVTLTRGDLTLFHQPIAAKILGGGYTTTLGELMFQAITKSDNTSNDKLMRSVGGPEAVRAMITAKHSARSASTMASARSRAGSPA